MSAIDYDAPQNVRECHWCGGAFGTFFAGQYGAREVWVARHIAGDVSSHRPESSDEVWSREFDEGAL